MTVSDIFGMLETSEEDSTASWAETLGMTEREAVALAAFALEALLAGDSETK